MKNEKQEECDCEHPEILEKSPEGCSLNQVIKCHGDEPFKDTLLKTCGCGCHQEKKE